MIAHIINLIEQFLNGNHPKPPLIVICGQTASGKTALSIMLAKKFNGEIVSADSRQVYKHLDIATDKIPLEKRENIPHYLLDIIEPDETFNAGDFKIRAQNDIEDILRRGKVPFIVGGTGLYIDVLVNNFQLFKPNPALREKLISEQKEKGNQSLHVKLQKLDPIAAQKIHPNNTHHIIRALEIVLSTNQVKQALKQPPLYNALKIGIRWPKELLHEYISNRVDDQIKRGLIQETYALFKHYSPDLPSLTSLGYKEIRSYLENKISLDHAIDLIKKNTRNYARRQITWFKRDSEMHWVDGETRLIS